MDAPDQKADSDSSWYSEEKGKLKAAEQNVETIIGVVGFVEVETKPDIQFHNQECDQG